MCFNQNYLPMQLAGPTTAKSSLLSCICYLCSASFKLCKVPSTTVFMVYLSSSLIFSYPPPFRRFVSFFVFSRLSCLALWLVNLMPSLPNWLDIAFNEPFRKASTSTSPADKTLLAELLVGEAPPPRFKNFPLHMLIRVYAPVA